jgi:hypothetical protein
MGSCWRRWTSLRRITYPVSYSGSKKRSPSRLLRELNVSGVDIPKLS